MPEANKISIPPIVRERLRSMPGTASHPDANQLSAFAENTLSVRERSQVMEHLAACADCRNIVALALPESEEVALPATAGPVKNLAFRWTATRWTAFAAAAAVLVAVVIVYRVQPAPESNVAMYTKQQAAAPPGTESTQSQEKTAAPVATPSVNKD